MNTSSIKQQQFYSLVLDSLVVIMEITGLVMSIGSMGANTFMYYTSDSNYFALIAFSISIIFTIMAMKKGICVPLWVKMLKYMAVSCLAVTFTVVILILIPMFGFQSAFEMLFGKLMKYHHFLCPVIAFVSYAFFTKQPVLSKRTPIIAAIPTLVYAIITTSLNVAKVMKGPYPFLYVYEQPVIMSVFWFICIVGLAWFLAWIIRKINIKNATKY